MQAAIHSAGFVAAWSLLASDVLLLSAQSTIADAGTFHFSPSKVAFLIRP
jgi:hypothetical protein